MPPPCKLDANDTEVAPVGVVAPPDSPDILGDLVNAGTDADADALSVGNKLASLLPAFTSAGSSSFGSPMSGHLHGNNSLFPKMTAPPMSTHPVAAAAVGAGLRGTMLTRFKFGSRT